MKTNPISAVASALLTCALIVTSCAKDVETDINVDPVGSAIRFSPAVGHTTRATETKIGNLGDFAVVARPMHHDGVLYDNYLIGSAEGGEIAQRSGSLSEDGTSGTWKLDRSVYWPSSMTNVLFFAYTAYKSGETYPENNFLGAINGDETSPSFGFDGDNPYINNFKPLKADLTEAEDDNDGIWADGKIQRDLLAAYTEQARATSATNVKIDFDHVLTQISITAKSDEKADDDHRIVKIKGAWIVNAAEAGKITAKLKRGTGDDQTKYDIEQVWTATGRTAYGSFYKDIITLDKNNDTDLLREHSLMIIPQDLKKWDPNGGSDNINGAYIMLLCRVELEHDGVRHEGESSNPNLDDIAIQGGKHYHQLFPVNETKFDGAEYGFVCVPLESDWNSKGIGKHYTYKLNICGNGTGAGQYPPVMTETDVNKLVPAGTEVFVVGETDPQPLKVVTDIPSKKHVGDNVLDDPIQFTVTVKAWEEPENWTQGTGSF